ncbi:MAG TPA: hypothetical protein VJS30_11330, partial [Paraburkholderia sp.]|nr:hypothetical protein [Paraburkholderia sp.]
WSIHTLLPKTEYGLDQYGANTELGSGEMRLRELTGAPILDWPIELPVRDPRGIFSAEKFECWKKASDSRKGVAGYYFSLKAHGQVALHSHLEARLLAYFEMCPFVVEIRTQYPQWDRDAFLAYCREGRLFVRKELMTIDFMLTLRIPGIPYRVYHGVSGKPFAQLELEPVKRRHKREADGLWKWGCTHEVMTEKTLSDIEYESYLRMFTHMGQVENEELGRLVGSAAKMASSLLATEARGDARRVVTMVGKRLGWDSNTSFRLLAIALFLGYLKWDTKHLYSPAKPLMFMRT